MLLPSFNFPIMSLLNKSIVPAVALSATAVMLPKAALPILGVRKSQPLPNVLSRHVIEAAERTRYRSLGRSAPYQSGKRW